MEKVHADEKQCISELKVTLQDMFNVKYVY